jgi:8-oxo-dGTP pyrophosphatase MutT (NUDIX family)
MISPEQFPHQTGLAKKAVHMTIQTPHYGEGDTSLAHQVAALCWRLHKNALQFVLITSRDTGRWVIPKGWPVPGLAPSAAAAREAWEEAGVIGRIGDRPLGDYLYNKVTSPALSIRCAVTVFPLRVAELKRNFPEAKQRRRRWVDAEKAAKLVAEPELASLFQSIAAQPGLLKGQIASGAA